ncbi:MAG: TraB/GumN family protein [Gemmataceae bacterium]|nr:TraB/GumN family protein [Gemmataceae bacterium]MCI0737460.1 TraB/GumN family protein [Gemmataceae bacterium]
MRHLISYASICGLCIGLVTLGCSRTEKKGDGKQGADNSKQHSNDVGFLWKATSGTNTVYLFGSMHAVKKEYYPLPAAVDDAFTQSKTLVVELDPNKLKPEVAAKLLMAHGMYPPGQTLSGSLSKKSMELLKAHCDAKGLKVQALNQFRPWAVMLTLVGQELAGLGYGEEFGHEKYFAAKAVKAEKPVLELETADMQIRLLADLSPEIQETYLSKTVAEMRKTKESLAAITAAWKAGDAKAMEQAMLASYREHPEFRPLMEKIFDERNVKMVERIEGFLKEKDSYFVIVGAGHLVGEKGILNLLEEKKHKVVQVRAPK